MVTFEAFEPFQLFVHPRKVYSAYCWILAYNFIPPYVFQKPSMENILISYVLLDQNGKVVYMTVMRTADWMRFS